MKLGEKKKVAVVGSRTFHDKHKLYEVLTKNFEKIGLIVSGGAEGADSLGAEWAKDYGVPCLIFFPLWHDPWTGAYNKGAGFKRNRQIAEEADVIFAFWDGVSRGTANTLEIAKQLNKRVIIVNFAPLPETKTDSTSSDDVPY